MIFKTSIFIRFKSATAVLCSIAVVVVLALFSTRLAHAAPPPSQQILAAELLIVRDDLTRLNDEANLPPAHIIGLRQRIQGSLGILPWLLRQAGDVSGANQMKSPVPTSRAQRDALLISLDQLIVHHPLDRAPYAPQHLTPKMRRDAFTIHETYCAGCHDDAGHGDEDAVLPARDLYFMARESPQDAFLARLINGVKGDETLLFTNPLTPLQIGALWQHYQK